VQKQVGERKRLVMLPAVVCVGIFDVAVAEARAEAGG